MLIVHFADTLKLFSAWPFVENVVRIRVDLPTHQIVYQIGENTTNERFTWLESKTKPTDGGMKFVTNFGYAIRM